jgi:hypothetical protein
MRGSDGVGGGRQSPGSRHSSTVSPATELGHPGVEADAERADTAHRRFTITMDDGFVGLLELRKPLRVYRLQVPSQHEQHVWLSRIWDDMQTYTMASPWALRHLDPRMEVVCASIDWTQTVANCNGEGSWLVAVRTLPHRAPLGGPNHHTAWTSSSNCTNMCWSWSRPPSRHFRYRPPTMGYSVTRMNRSSFRTMWWYWLSQPYLKVALALGRRLEAPVLTHALSSATMMYRGCVRRCLWWCTVESL